MPDHLSMPIVSSSGGSTDIEDDLDRFFSPNKQNRQEELETPRASPPTPMPRSSHGTLNTSPAVQGGKSSTPQQNKNTPIAASSSPQEQIAAREKFYSSDVSPTYTYPAALPSVCPNSGCPGKLKVQTSDRRNASLLSMGTSPYRWLVSCSGCSSTWHACHFGCGHLQKRNKNGSSEISRHEKGRYGRWQRGFRPACPNNPQRDELQRAYSQAREDTIKQESTVPLAQPPPKNSYTASLGVSASSQRELHTPAAFPHVVGKEGGGWTGATDGATDSDLLEVAELLGFIEEGCERLVGMPDKELECLEHQHKHKRVRVNLGTCNSSNLSYDDNSRHTLRAPGTVSGWAHFYCSLYHCCPNRLNAAAAHCTSDDTEFYENQFARLFGKFGKFILGTFAAIISLELYAAHFHGVGSVPFCVITLVGTLLLGTPADWKWHLTVATGRDIIWTIVTFIPAFTLAQIALHSKELAVLDLVLVALIPILVAMAVKLPFKTALATRLPHIAVLSFYWLYSKRDKPTTSADGRSHLEALLIVITIWCMSMLAYFTVDNSDRRAYKAATATAVAAKSKSAELAHVNPPQHTHTHTRKFQISDCCVKIFHLGIVIAAYCAKHRYRCLGILSLVNSREIASVFRFSSLGHQSEHRSNFTAM